MARFFLGGGRVCVCVRSFVRSFVYMYRWTFGYFNGFFYLPLFSTLIPRSVRKVRSLRRLPPDRDIKFRKESPVFVVRISSTSKPATQYSSSMGSSNYHPLLGLWHLYTYSPNRLWSSKHKLSSAGRTMPLPEHETNHSQLLWEI